MKIHIVQQGDTLWKIAKKYNVDFEQLKSMNTHLSDPDLIMPGMKIKIPSDSVHVKKQKKEAPAKKEEAIAPKPPPPLKKPSFLKKKKEGVKSEFEPMPEENIPKPPKGVGKMNYFPMVPSPPMAMPCGCSAVMPYPHYHPYPMTGGMMGYGYPNMAQPMTMGEMKEESSSFLPNMPNKAAGVGKAKMQHHAMHDSSQPMPMHPSYGVEPAYMGMGGANPNYPHYGMMPVYYDPYHVPYYQPAPISMPGYYGYQAHPYPPDYRDEVADEEETEYYRDHEEVDDSDENESV